LPETMTAAARVEQLDVAIIGGGLAGISCALALCNTGLRVTIFERSAQLGGRATSWREPATGDVIDIGPHILLSEYRNMLDMLASLGTARDVLWQTDRFVTLLENGRRIPMRVHSLPAPFHLLPSLMAVDSLAISDKLSNARITLLAMRARPEDFDTLDRLNGLELLNAYGVSPRLQEFFWATAAMALLNVPLHECSAGALLRMYAQLIARNGYQSGFAARPLADLFVPQALRTLAYNRIRVETAVDVQQLGLHDDRICSVRLSNGRQVRAKTFVAAIPPGALAKLLRNSGATDARWRSLDAFEPCPYVSTYLWLDRKVTRAQFWSRVWSASDLNTDFYDLSNIRRDVAGCSLIASNSIYNHASEQMSDDEIIGRTHRELCDFAPLAAAAHVRHAVVNRIPMAICSPRPGTEVARPHTVTSIDGLLLAGDWTNTGLPSCMEGATYSGRRAAEHALQACGRDYSLAIPPPSPKGLVKLVRSLWPRPGGVQYGSDGQTSAAKHA
jgi:squalene-associated FAD-dependent desaturase